MIKLQDLTPSVYYDKSRDFQFIGRLYDGVLNSVKTDADAIYNMRHLGKSTDKLLDLLAMTLGFKAKHTYNSAQLVAVCSVLPTILRNKGSLAAVLLMGQAILNSIGSADKFNAEMEQNILKIYIPEGATDMALFNDILDYIIPAGTTCETVRGVLLQQATTTRIAVNMSNIAPYSTEEENLSRVATGNYNYEVEKYANIVGFSQNNTIVRGTTISTENAADESTQD